MVIANSFLLKLALFETNRKLLSAKKKKSTFAEFSSLQTDKIEYSHSHLHQSLDAFVSRGEKKEAETT